MPRYKAKCSCGSEWWVTRRLKLDESQLHQLKRRSLCANCANIYRNRVESVRTGEVQLSESELHQCDVLIKRLEANEHFGFTQQPFRTLFLKQLAEDRDTVRKGISTRYPGFSPAREMLQYRYRVLISEYVLSQLSTLAPNSAPKRFQGSEETSDGVRKDPATDGEVFALELIEPND